LKKLKGIFNKGKDMSFHQDKFHKHRYGERTEKTARIIEEYVEYEMVKLVKRLVKKFPFEDDLDAMKFLHGYFRRNPFGAYVSGK